jgi:hypothetical protein
MSERRMLCAHAYAAAGTQKRPASQHARSANSSSMFVFNAVVGMRDPGSGIRLLRIPDPASRIPAPLSSVQFVNLRIRTFRISPNAASVAIIDEPP